MVLSSGFCVTDHRDGARVRLVRSHRRTGLVCLFCRVHLHTVGRRLGSHSLRWQSRAQFRCPLLVDLHCSHSRGCVRRTTRSRCLQVPARHRVRCASERPLTVTGRGRSSGLNLAALRRGTESAAPPVTVKVWPCPRYTTLRHDGPRHLRVRHQKHSLVSRSHGAAVSGGDHHFNCAWCRRILPVYRVAIRGAVFLRAISRHCADATSRAGGSTLVACHLFLIWPAWFGLARSMAPAWR